MGGKGGTFADLGEGTVPPYIFTKAQARWAEE